jgi:hypothetical protein
MSVPEKMPYTYGHIACCKFLVDKDGEQDDRKLRNDYMSLIKYDGCTNSRGFAGNKLLYHFQMTNLLKCRRGTDLTLREIFENDVLKEKLWKDAIKRRRRKNAPYPSETDVFECFRANKGAVVFFKPITAKYLYTQFKATKVLDFTMGWGGRMLGAIATPSVVKYTGIDTNKNMEEVPPPQNNFLKQSHTEIDLKWESCVDVDYSKIEYDFVLTSPPYLNLEMYEGMKPFESDKTFYIDFLKKTLDAIIENIIRGGWVCLNVSPKMFADMMKYEVIRTPDRSIDLKQQMGNAKKSQDMIYCWNIA